MASNARGRDTRRRLLEAGLRVFASLPVGDRLAGLRAADVAAAAGTTTGAFYHAFGDHGRFVDSLVEYGLAAEGGADDSEIESTVEALLAYAQAPPGRLASDLQDIAELTYSLSLRAPHLRAFEYGIWGSRADPAVGQHLRALYDDFTADYVGQYDVIIGRWGRVPRPPFTTEKIAVILTALMDGMTIRHGISPDAAPPGLYGQAVLALLPAITRPTDDRRDLYRYVQEHRVPDWRLSAGRARRERSRRDVVAATLDLLEEIPFDDLTIERIAAEAGVHPSTVYDNFGNKAGVANAAFADLVAPLVRRTQQSLAAGAPPLQVVRDGLVALTETAIAHRALLPGLFRANELSYRTDRAGVANPLPAVIVPAVAAAQREGSLRADLDPLVAAATLTGLAMRTVGLVPDAGVDEIVDYLFQLCFEGLYTRPVSTG